MDGVDYPGDEDDDVDMDPHSRRVSEPSRKRAHLETPQDVERQVYRQHSSTYPPPAIPPHARGDMAPPQVVHPNAGAATSPRDMSGQPSPAVNSYYNGSCAQVFPQQGPMMTESPKPLSPGQPSDQHRLSVTDPNAASSARNRSPSLASQLQQQHLSRASAGGGGRTPPQHPPAQQFPPHPAQPQLPPLTASSQRPFANPGPSSLHHQQIPPASASNAGSMSSHGRSSGSSLRDVLGSGSGSGASGPEAPGAPGPDIWAYVRGLEARFGRMQDEYELRISRMQEEIFALKAQVAGGGSGVGGYGGGGVGEAAAAMQRH
ncbi:hypothetical protein WHR41_02815 [Cladosporium halotolerans]|uniref:Uncharacterized protein n=1 Tax=Cladosporium halotolerans TaxID=1052096 RepID=A0AB34KU37_9PEZI